MERRIVKEQPSEIKRAAPEPRRGLEHYCRDLCGWPHSWMGLEKDLLPGEQLLVLGGEFIRDLHNDPSLREKPVGLVLAQMIEYGGPLLYHGREDQQRSFDSTCSKFRRFLTRTAL